jgi:hypothetical protein
MRAARLADSWRWALWMLDGRHGVGDYDRRAGYLSTICGIHRDHSK